MTLLMMRIMMITYTPSSATCLSGIFPTLPAVTIQYDDYDDDDDHNDDHDHNGHDSILFKRNFLHKLLLSPLLTAIFSHVRFKSKCYITGNLVIFSLANSASAVLAGI